jgi:23S rRNA (adenine2503-C2)-methyltransferase
MDRRNIKALTMDELTGTLLGLGMKKYRAGQIHEWIYGKFAETFDVMTNIPRTDRHLLSERFSLPALGVARVECSRDGTRKFLFQLEDLHTIESVLIPDEDRKTLCISSQVGCAQACGFCLTGKGGFQRNLQAFEIVDQVLLVEKMLAAESRDSAARQPSPGMPEATTARGRFRNLTNIVFMGMGEPLANIESVLQAIRIITEDKGLGFSPRRITLSTSGLVPAMDQLGKSGSNVNLAVSLNAGTDEVRSRIMPVNRRFPIKELLNACRRFPLDDRRRITFEYVLLADLNDSEEDALRLVKLLRGIRCKVNLIPFNPFPGSGFRRPDDAVVRRFQMILLNHHMTAPVRESRGRDISAACGQLRGQISPPVQSLFSGACAEP